MSKHFRLIKILKYLNYSFNSLALVGFGEKRVFVGFLGGPALTGDSRGCFVDFAPVILSTTPETISGVAGARTALGGLSYKTEKKEVEEIHVGETFEILKISH